VRVRDASLLRTVVGRLCAAQARHAEDVEAAWQALRVLGASHATVVATRWREILGLDGPLLLPSRALGDPSFTPLLMLVHGAASVRHDLAEALPPRILEHLSLCRDVYPLHFTAEWPLPPLPHVRDERESARLAPSSRRKRPPLLEAAVAEGTQPASTEAMLREALAWVASLREMDWRRPLGTCAKDVARVLESLTRAAALKGAVRSTLVYLRTHVHALLLLLRALELLTASDHVSTLACCHEALALCARLQFRFVAVEHDARVCALLLRTAIACVAAASSRPADLREELLALLLRLRLACERQRLPMPRSAARVQEELTCGGAWSTVRCALSLACDAAAPRVDARVEAVEAEWREPRSNLERPAPIFPRVPQPVVISVAASLRGLAADADCPPALLVALPDRRVLRAPLHLAAGAGGGAPVAASGSVELPVSTVLRWRGTQTLRLAIALEPIDPLTGARSLLLLCAPRRFALAAQGVGVGSGGVSVGSGGSEQQ
jgi:hypothetical protein